MFKRFGLFHALTAFLLLYLLLWLFLIPGTRVGQCPGQFVLYSALNHDESQLLLVTLPRSPFG